jgi:hypothetical protein
MSKHEFVCARVGTSKSPRVRETLKTSGQADTADIYIYKYLLTLIYIYVRSHVRFVSVVRSAQAVPA